MPEEKKQGGGEPEIKTLSVSLADLAEDEEEQDEEEEAAEPEKVQAPPAKPAAGDMSNLLDDIFAEEVDESDHLKSFGDLEHLTMIEVAAEVEAVLEELRIRQGGHE